MLEVCFHLPFSNVRPFTQLANRRRHRRVPARAGRQAQGPGRIQPALKAHPGSTRELSEAPGGSGSGSGTTSTGHNVTVSGSNITIAESGQATSPADMALAKILNEAKFLHGSHSRQISGLQKKLANAAHNLQKKEDELSDQLVAYGCLEGKYEAMKAKYEALRAAG
ncbi:unnamed protein product [Tilletia controversa]|nr:unnamed protein product [Tilletia controversa]